MRSLGVLGADAVHHGHTNVPLRHAEHFHPFHHFTKPTERSAMAEPSVDRAKAMLGLTQATSLSEGIRRTAKWHVGW